MSSSITVINLESMQTVQHRFELPVLWVLSVLTLVTVLSANKVSGRSVGGVLTSLLGQDALAAKSLESPRLKTMNNSEHERREQ